MNKSKIIMLIVIFLSVIIVGLYGTFAMINTQVSKIENIDYTFTIGKTTNQEIIMSSNTTKTFDIILNNPYEGALNYGITYSVKDNYDINIGTLNTSENKAHDIIEKQETKKISIIISNTTENDVVINLNIVTGYIKGGDLIIKEGEKLIDKTININNIIDTNLDESKANYPNITKGMIPIYYDNKDQQWHKADKSNTNSNYQWYNYGNKIWANVALVSKTKMKEYQKIELGEIINTEDILGYFVWVPRFKYKVWDIQKINDQSKYSYNATQDGINIIFEEDTKTTGEIKCKQDNTCTGENGQYFTHPAFSFGDKELTGFWIGKFETTGTKDKPTILPNYNSLTFLNIKEEIETAKLLTSTEEYNLKDEKIDSHVIKDLEWSAVSFLTNSIYGICNGAKNGCKNIYPNRSLYYNTGTSEGKNTEPSNFGYYSYLGEKLDEYGIATEIIDTQIISSTTGNVYGIYDMAGGADETVMLTTNKDSLYLKDLEEKYYDIISKERKLGQLPYEIMLEQQIEEIWFTRGGNSVDENAKIQDIKTYNGDSQDNISFRIVLT